MYATQTRSFLYDLRMFSFYALKMNLTSSASQPELIQNLKSQGSDVIQTNDGLCLKTEMSKEELDKFLSDKNVSGVSVAKIEVSQTHELTPDVCAFMGLNE